jgi:Holliday junction resolvase-like predicted endonuclease
MYIDLDQLTRDYGKMEAITVQRQKILLELDNTYLQQKKQLMEVNIEMENRTHELRVQIQELKGELNTFHKALGKVSQTKPPTWTTS